MGNKNEGLFFPVEWIEEQLKAHLVEDHNANPEKLWEVGEGLTFAAWTVFLQMAHTRVHEWEDDKRRHGEV